MHPTPAYDAILLLSFGGPEGPDDVMPFLENVTRGRNVPRERLLEVSEHYHHFGGKSPINDQNRSFITALKAELEAHDISLPIYWGNRNWYPLLPDTMQQMADDGIQRVLTLITSTFSSYSSCRQYLENIADARELVGAKAPIADKIRVYYNHPGFIVAQTDRVQQALGELPAEARSEARLIFTAHSIPQSMAAGCDYETQLREASGLVAESAGNLRWNLVYQSRSGPPQIPWLEPDVCDFLRALKEEGDVQHVVVVPIGFVSDHLEVLFDLDTEAQELAAQLGLNMIRAATVGCHPRFVQGCRELIEERIYDRSERPALGTLGPRPDTCREGCCPARMPQR